MASSLSDEVKAVCQLCAVPALKNSLSIHRLLLLMAKCVDQNTKDRDLSRSVKTSQIGVKRKHSISRCHVKIK